VLTNATPTAPIAPLPGTIASTKPKAASPRSEQVAAIPVEPEKPAAQPSSRRSVSAAEEEYEMQRARALIENADIAAARLIYEAMAFKGSAPAAFAMGQTFDPDFLRNFTVGGLKPDIARAKKWYKKAVELGSSEAQNRLAALE
jgi:TPR repeat protein